MEENEQNRRSQDWKSQYREDHASEDFGLPDVSYDPVEKEESFGHDHQDAHGERYYDYEEKKNPVAGFIVGLIFLLLIAGGVYWYFFLYNPGSETIETFPEQTFETTPEPIVPAVEEEPVIEEPVTPAEPVKGSLFTISSASGSYYVVVGSFIDDDLAKDHSERLNVAGTNTFIIEPYANNRYYRLAVGNFDTWSQAAQKMQELKTTFGEEIWVLKY